MTRLALARSGSFWQGRRNDLPRESILVLEPAALLRLRVAAGSELLPVIVHLLLRLAFDIKGNRTAWLEKRPAIQRHEALPFEFENGSQHLSFHAFHRAFQWAFGIALEAHDPGVLENRKIET